MHIPKSFPPVDSQALKHSQRVEAYITNEIDKSNGKISFARFMELALYAPALGYYNAGTRKFGPSGDFVTAPEISPLFSQCLARQCLQILTTIRTGDILEFGAGSGIMAADLIHYLEQHQCLPQHYYIVELSADLANRQQQLLQDKCPALFDRFIWLQDLSDLQFEGVILANEVLDAMPVNRFMLADGNMKEAYVAAKNGELELLYASSTNQELIDFVTKLQHDTLKNVDDYHSEANLYLAPWFQTISDILKRGLALIIDYGYPQREYYHPQRNQGTLTCFYRHHRHHNPLILPGLQDISAHVNFSQAAESAHNSGFDIAGFTTQASFLINCGLAELMYNENSSEKAKFIQNQAIKTLTLPQEMGEIVKVLAISKQLDLDLLGLQQHNLITRL